MSFHLVASRGPATGPAPSGAHLPIRGPRCYPSDTTPYRGEIIAPYVPIGGTTGKAATRWSIRVATSSRRSATSTTPPAGLVRVELAGLARPHAALQERSAWSIRPSGGPLKLPRRRSGRGCGIRAGVESGGGGPQRSAC